jgi:hypothetical protein
MVPGDNLDPGGELDSTGRPIQVGAGPGKYRPGTGTSLAGVGETASVAVQQCEWVEDPRLGPGVACGRFEQPLAAADRHLNRDGQVHEVG